MVKASLISVGDELLDGSTVDTNAAFLSRQLVELGIEVVSAYTVADDVDRIVRVLDLARQDAEVVLVTGGLGPTDDDLTRQALARWLRVELELRQELVCALEEFFARRGVVMPEKNRVQAYVPQGCEVLPNPVGTAAGIVADWGQGGLVAAMPGVPSEMQQMFQRLRGRLERLGGRGAIAIRRLRCFGTGESNIAERLGSLMHRGRNPRINTTASAGVITVHIVARAESQQDAERMAQADEQWIRQQLGEVVFGTDEQSLPEVVGRYLAEQGKSLAVAESCTGGMVTKLLTDIPGASRYLTYGWVTYSNQAKITELGVPAELIEQHGAVSEPVCRAMAEGARKKANADYAIGITGIAGPGGGSEQKPEGLVYICVEAAEGADAVRCVFLTGRQSVRLRAAYTALNMLRLRLSR